MSHTVEPSRFHAEEARNTHERRNAYFSAGVLTFGKAPLGREMKKIPNFACPFISAFALPPLYYTCRDKSRDTK